jgi:hypothetical protein
MNSALVEREGTQKPECTYCIKLARSVHLSTTAGSSRFYRAVVPNSVYDRFESKSNCWQQRSGLALESKQTDRLQETTSAAKRCGKQTTFAQSKGGTHPTPTTVTLEPSKCEGQTTSITDMVVADRSSTTSMHSAVQTTITLQRTISLCQRIC